MVRFHMRRKCGLPVCTFIFSFSSTINGVVHVCILHSSISSSGDDLTERSTYKLQLPLILFLSSKMAEKSGVIACHTVGSWKQQLLKGKQSDKLIVVDFTATWCGPCRAMAPVFAELAKKMSNVIFLKVDVDELVTVAAEWGVSALPCFMFLKNGKVVDRFVGARKDALQKIVLQHA